MAQDEGTGGESHQSASHVFIPEIGRYAGGYDHPSGSGEEVHSHNSDNEEDPEGNNHRQQSMSEPERYLENGEEGDEQSD